jgi:hypothetical protein
VKPPGLSSYAPLRDEAGMITPLNELPGRSVEKLGLSPNSMNIPRGLAVLSLLDDGWHSAHGGEDELIEIDAGLSRTRISAVGAHLSAALEWLARRAVSHQRR